MMSASPDWISIALLGSLHGVNPAMGWLFAVSLGLQAQDGRAVWSALGPLAVGHALAGAAAVAAPAVLGIALPLGWVRLVAAGALLGVGVLHLRGHTHVRTGAGMRVGGRQLTTWSFLVSSAHGAGLMVLPFVLRDESSATHEHANAQTNAHAHAAHLASVISGDQMTALLATLVHTAGYLAVCGTIAWVVYTWLGLRFLRSAWINMNFVWAIALVATALATPLI
jgi:hypothetical protein